MLKSMDQRCVIESAHSPCWFMLHAALFSAVVNMCHKSHSVCKAVKQLVTQHAGLQGIQHLQSAMASYMRMKGVHFHQLGHKSQETLGCSEPVHGSKDGQQSQTLLPVIKNDAVVISAVVLQPEAGIATAGEPNPHKRQKTDNQGSAAAQVQVCL